MIAANANIAAAVVALLVQKGGTLRLRKSELATMGDLVLTITPNPNNPDVLHFGTMLKSSYEAAMAAAALVQQAPPVDEKSVTDPAKDEDAK